MVEPVIDPISEPISDPISQPVAQQATLTANDATPAQDIQITICYARPGLQFLRQRQVAAGSTIAQVLLGCGVLQELTNCRVGIYGKLKTLETVLRDQDRLEIYRPLIADPKDARRRRAKQALA